MLSRIDNKTVRIIEHVAEEGLKTGEKVKIAKIQFWVEELGQWMTKKDPTTFFPAHWDLKKIKEVVKEASENITLSKGNKFQGIAKNGIEIEFYIDTITREISTAYITF